MNKIEKKQNQRSVLCSGEPSPSREGWASASEARNLQSLMEAFPQDTSKMISLQDAPMELLSLFHHSDSTSLPAKKRPSTTTMLPVCSCLPSAHSIPVPSPPLGTRKTPSAISLHNFDSSWGKPGDQKTRVNQSHSHVPSSLSVRQKGFAALSLQK